MLGRLRAGGEGEDGGKMVGWHHQLEGHESEKTPGAGEGQRSLVWWGCKEWDMTEWLNWIELKISIINRRLLPNSTEVADDLSKDEGSENERIHYRIWPIEFGHHFLMHPLIIS